MLLEKASLMINRGMKLLKCRHDNVCIYRSNVCLSLQLMIDEGCSNESKSIIPLSQQKSHRADDEGLICMLCDFYRTDLFVLNVAISVMMTSGASSLLACFTTLTNSCSQRKNTPLIYFLVIPLSQSCF